jgi:hypothetical protein
MEEATDNKILLTPDYDNDLDDDDDDIEFDDLEDEGASETLLDSYLGKSENEDEEKEEEKPVITTPFGNSTPTPSWNTGGSSGFWGNNKSQNQAPPYAYSQPQQKPSTGPSWGSAFSQPNSIWGQQSRPGNTQNEFTIDRSKEIIVCDFLDVIAQTCESDGKPGLLPRDIYDLVPRLNVWSMIKAFNPKYVYGLFPSNLIPNTNGADGWKVTLNYYCCSLSAFLRLPFKNCQMLVQSRIGQSKEELILRAIRNLCLNKSTMLYIGIYSGLYYGQSNEDALAAERCGIDYMDLNQLLK